MVVRASWGYYSTYISILNILEENLQHQDNSIGEGNYGVVYKGYFLDKKLAIKCIPIKSAKTRSIALK